MIELIALGLTYHQARKSAYVMVLGEKDGNRRIPIVIGTSEAQSIAWAMRGLTTSRPLSHDLLLSIAEFKNIHLQRAYIYRIENEVFYTELLFVDEEGQELRLESRVSDAVALAVRTHTPIYTTEQIMDQYGIEFTEHDTKPKQPATPSEYVSSGSNTPLSFQTREELQSNLQQCIQNEDYERAALIKAELNRRGGVA